MSLLSPQPTVSQQARDWQAKKKRARKVQKRVRRIVARDRPVRVPSEDSLPLGVTRRLGRRGWDYTEGAWTPPSLQFLPGTQLGTRQAKKPKRL